MARRRAWTYATSSCSIALLGFAKRYNQTPIVRCSLCTSEQMLFIESLRAHMEIGIFNCWRSLGMHWRPEWLLESKGVDRALTMSISRWSLAETQLTFRLRFTVHPSSHRHMVYRPGCHRLFTSTHPCKIIICIHKRMSTLFFIPLSHKHQGQKVNVEKAISFLW